MEDDQHKKNPISHEIGMILDPLSVSELEQRVGLLETEIIRLKAAIAARGDTRRAAEAAFRI